MQESSIVKKFVGMHINSPYSPPNTRAIPSARTIMTKDFIRLTPVMEDLRDMRLSSDKKGNAIHG